jgi:hypothetical protein
VLEGEKLKTLPVDFPYCTPCPTDEAHRHTRVAALLGHTGHTITNGVLGVSVWHIHIFFTFILEKRMTKKNKASESEPGDKPRTSKHRIQHSAPLASTVSTTEMAKKPKSAAVAAEGAPLVAEVAKGTSATNVAEEERKMPALPKYAAVPREVFGAGPVAVEVAPLVKAVKAQGVAGEKLVEAEDKDKEDEDGDNDSASGDNEEEESGNEGSKYAPVEEGSEGTVSLADDPVAPDNPLDKVKPVQKVSSPFDLPILPIAKTLLAKQGKKGKKVPGGDEDSILLLSNDEAEEATPLRSQKKQ